MEDVYTVLFCSLGKAEYREILCAQLDYEAENGSPEKPNMKRLNTHLKVLG